MPGTGPLQFVVRPFVQGPKTVNFFLLCRMNWIEQPGLLVDAEEPPFANVAVEKDEAPPMNAPRGWAAAIDLRRIAEAPWFHATAQALGEGRLDRATAALQKHPDAVIVARRKTPRILQA
jgi:hypothetical protein